jgi:hypothetical protein
MSHGGTAAHPFPGTRRRFLSILVETPMTATASAEDQLAGFLAAYAPDVAAVAMEVVEKLRPSLPGTTEMVYDNYNGLVIGFVPNDRPTDAILSVALAPRWVNLCFLQAAALPDPDHVLLGSGSVARHVRLDSAADVDRSAVRRLVADAVARARVPPDPTRERRLVIKSISAKQRPRRPA